MVRGGDVVVPVETRIGAAVAAAPLDPDVAALAASVADRPPVDRTPLTEMRERVRAGNALCSSGPEIDIVEDFVLPDSGVPARRYAPEGATSVMVYLHGGGWATGDLDFADEFARFVADRCRAEVFSLDYRLAPEHPFPVPLEDCWSGLVEVARSFGRGRPVLIAGDSAGGNLAAACAQRARDHEHDDVAIAGQVLIYPVTDSRDDHDSYARAEEAFPIGRAAMRWFWEQYAPDAEDRDRPEAAVLRAADLRGLPPALVVLAGHDPLHDEGLAYARALSEAGVDVQLLDFPTLSHGFLRITGAAPAAVEARDLIVEHLSSFIGDAAAT